jgi:uncharacterized protein YhdP
MLAQLQRGLPIRLFAKVLLGLIAVVVAFSLVALLLIRFWLWPSLPQWQEDVLASTRAKLADRGLALEVGAVVADWERWYRPRLTVEKIALRDGQGQALAELAQAQATIGLGTFASLWRLTPIFSEIRLQDPKVTGLRDATGALFVAGFRVGPQDLDKKEPRDTQVIEWLLRQGRIRIERGAFTWLDAPRAKSMEIENIAMSVRNLGHRHSWSLQASVSPAIGEGFSMQGNFKHPFFKGPTAFADWSGDLFVQFDRVDLSQLFEFVQLPQATPLRINSGFGSIKAWAELSSRQINEITVDLDLAKGSLQWGAGRRPLTFEQLSGRVDTLLSGASQQVRLQDLSLQSEQLSQPVRIGSAQLKLEQDPATGESSLNAQSQMIDLAAARWLIEHLPVDQALKDSVARLKPSGYLRGLNLSLIDRPQGPMAISLESGFEDLALSAGAQSPSFSGLSGQIKGTDSSGSISIDTSKAVFTFPRVFEEPRIALGRLNAQAAWSFGPKPEGAASAPLKLNITSLSASNADLAIEASGVYTTSDTGPGDIDLKGKVLRAAPARIHRYVPVAAGSTTRKWLRESLKEASPYRAEFVLAGPLEKFPYADGKSGKFLVKARVEDGRLQPAPGWPIFSGIKADVIFERADFRLVAQQAKFAGLNTSRIRAQINDLNAIQTLLQVEGALSGDLQQFFVAANQSPVKNWLGGITESMSGRAETRLDLSMNLNLSESRLSRYTGKLTLGKGALQVLPKLPNITLGSGVVEFDESGLGAFNIQGQALGGPLKASNQGAAGAANRLRLQIEGQATGRGLEQWAGQALGVTWKDQLSGSTPFSVAVDLGGAATQATVNTTLKGITSKLSAPLSKSPTEDWTVRVDYRGAGAATELQIDAPKVKGQLRWRAAQKTDAVLTAQLERLWLDSRSNSQPQVVEDKNNDMLANQWPRVDLAVTDFRVGLREWGRVELQALPFHATRSWEISRLSIVNPDAVLTAQGSWSTRALDARTKARSRTVLDLELEMKNGGRLLGRAGYPNVVRDTEGKISGQLGWSGSPLDFSGPGLSGKLALSLENGRFLKAEPGVARLVGVLNLQSLPRRIKLDFSDVFSEGFSYERIRGDLEFVQGDVSTKNLRIVGVQASVFLEGSARIRDETQDLRVLVLPEVNAGLASLGYAALVNPAIGLGAFLAQYVLRDPVRRLLAYEYQITGKWDDPVVTPIAKDTRADLPSVSPSGQ